MNWFDQVDGYCERTDFTYWAEPFNAVTNAAFIIAAVIMWRRCAGLVWGRVLCVILFSIGVGSFLFHTHATVWSGVADVAPIGLFILTYLFLVNRDVMGWPLWAALLGTLGFLPYAAGVTLLLRDVSFFSISNFYWTVPILLVIYGLYLLGSAVEVARGMLIGAAILACSISLRSLDESLCERFPIGTHIFWHLLNGVMLGWMIEVYRRHMVEGAAKQE